MENIWKVHENIIILGPAPCASKNEEITFCRPCLNVARVHTWSLWIVGESCGIHWNWRIFHNLDFVEEQLSAFFTWEMKERSPNTCANLEEQVLRRIWLFSASHLVLQMPRPGIPLSHLSHLRKRESIQWCNDTRTAIPRMAIMQSCTCR